MSCKPYSAFQEIMNKDEGKEMIRTCVGLCQAPNCLEWAQLFVEGLICVERFIGVYEICRNENLVFTLLGTCKYDSRITHKENCSCTIDKISIQYNYKLMSNEQIIV